MQSCTVTVIKQSDTKIVGRLTIKNNESDKRLSIPIINATFNVSAQINFTWKK